jgi:serine/threonine-protein kinase HipA
MNDKYYGVWLYGQLVGMLGQRGDFTWFRFTDAYLTDPDRSVLGLIFEENLTAPHTGMLRLPAWFSNLLPEGILRSWIAEERHVSPDREMELLAQVGHDLPGAVQVVAADLVPDSLGDIPLIVEERQEEKTGPTEPIWRFSLAGVGLKFSMVRTGDRLTLPAYGEGGDWIVKLPDTRYEDVPRNENTMMTLASHASIEVPEHFLIDRSDLDMLPNGVWPGTEEYAYAVRRFDRGENRNLIHIEDFAQVRNIYPYDDRKYQGNFETVAALAYRGQDLPALQQVARRIAFNVLISNGDAHLKNWSLIYYDRRRPTLSPAYDLVSTEFYRQTGLPEDLGLQFGKSRRFDLVNLSTFTRLERKLGVARDTLTEVVQDTVVRTVAAWPDVSSLISDNPALRESIDHSIRTRRVSILQHSPPLGSRGIRRPL